MNGIAWGRPGRKRTDATLLGWPPNLTLVWVEPEDAGLGLLWRDFDQGRALQ